MAEALQAPILANSAKSRSYQKGTVRFHKAMRGVGQTSEALYNSFLKNPCPEGQLNKRQASTKSWRSSAVRPVRAG